METIVTINDQEVMNFNDYFYYDESSKTCLRWKINRYSGFGHKTPNTKAGDEAGYMAFGYWCVTLNRKRYCIHRIIFEMMNGITCPPIIDHINRDKLDNKIENLRAATKELNGQNCKMTSRNKSGINGVHFQIKGAKWIADWKYEKKTCHKSFSSRKYGYEEAFRLACAYREKMIEWLNENGAGYTDKHGKP